jgi:metal-sulfur cluster biosynthetic enzyme
MKTKIVDILKQCYDPEIPIDLWNLGLIYDINITTTENNKNDVKITMSLTTPGCTMGQHMADDIKNKVKTLEKINNIEVTVTFDPPWTPEMMTDYAREKLGYDPVKTKSIDQKINVEWE